MATAAPAVASAAPVARFALVIGHNQAPRSDLAALRYADDDAVRWSVLLRTYGARVELLTELDDESLRLYAGTVGTPQRPTGAALRGAMARLVEAMRAARAAGQRTVFYFVYAGHGDTDDAGEGYVTLADGRLSRSEFGRQVLAASPANANHVVVDACRAFYFVYDRGAGGTRRPFNGRYFASGLAATHRNTGFLLATSSGAPSHEWEEFQAGIFSHELRSALLGAADVDGDGRVSYRELAAFLEVANRPVRNERYRPAFAINAPLDGDGSLLDLADASGGQLYLPPTAEGRRLLEDPLGVRWADLHPGPGQAITLRIPAPPWEASHFFVRQPQGDSEYEVPAGQRLSVTDLSVRRSGVLRRGAAHEAFVRLFSLPFAGADVAATPDPRVVATKTAPAPSRPVPWRRIAPWAAVGTGAVALGTAAFLARDARRLGNDQSVLGERRPAVNERIDSRNRWTAITAAGGGLLVGAGAAVLLHDWLSGGGQVAWRPAVTPLAGGALAAVEIRR
jgi:hypothetical protein